jgi:hypothetical protein
VEAGAGRVKGKIVRSRGMAHFEPEDSDEDEDEWEGMPMDAPEEAEIPSNVVVLDRLDREVSAIMFEAFSRDRLHRGLRPSRIINPQGCMWLRFEDVTTGQRAFGVLCGLYAGSTRSFVSDDVFADAALYTRDMWSADLTADVSMPFAELTLLPTQNTPTSPPARDLSPMRVSPPPFGSPLPAATTVTVGHTTPIETDSAVSLIERSTSE